MANDLIGRASTEASIKPQKDGFQKASSADAQDLQLATSLLVSAVECSHFLSLWRDLEEDRPRLIQHGMQK